MDVLGLFLGVNTATVAWYIELGQGLAWEAGNPGCFLKSYRGQETYPLCRN